jgi:hypothetical protein
MSQDTDEDRMHQVLVERGPRSRRWILICLVVSLTGLAILVACALTSTGSPWDVAGVVMFVPFGAMAINGTYWTVRRGRNAP